MSLDSTQVDQIARLARLALGKGELAEFQRELDAILMLIERMQGVDTAGFDPLAHPLDITARLRPDEVTEHDQRARFQCIAPAVERGHYLVPRVIE